MLNYFYEFKGDKTMLQNIIGRCRKAIEDYQMIEENDKIGIGLSGGKDSLALLYALYYLRKFYPKKFDIMAITVDPGLENFDTKPLEKLCQELKIEYVVYPSDIATVVFDIRKEKNPCSLCANLRRGILNSVAIEHGCNKIALGHHNDDVIETLLMSLFLNGNFYTFSPVTYLSRSNITVIRPMIYVTEKEIRAAAREKNFPIIEKTCPNDGYSKREFTKTLITDLKKDIPKIKENLFGAIKRSNIPGWEIKQKD